MLMHPTLQPVEANQNDKHVSSGSVLYDLATTQQQQPPLVLHKPLCSSLQSCRFFVFFLVGEEFHSSDLYVHALTCQTNLLQSDGGNCLGPACSFTSSVSSTCVLQG